MNLNQHQLDVVRTKPQQTRLYLGIYKPSTALACRVNDAAITKGARIITYDGVTAGSFLAVESGMTLYVGTTAGAHDCGRIRARAADATTITIAENDHIDWKDNLYLTVVKFFEPWGIYQRILLQNNIPIYYKDYDIAYIDQNQNFQPIVDMGPNHAGFIETGSMGVYFSASGTYDPTDGSSPTGYNWCFEGGQPTGSFVHDPGYIQYAAPGHFTARLTVTSNQGKTRTGHRHIMAFQKPGEGLNTPIQNWGFDGIQGSRDSFGYSASFWLREQADFAKVVEGALIVIFADHNYGLLQKGLLGGNAAGRANTIFVGYIDDESIRFDSYTSELKFNAASITKIMDERQTFSVALQDVVSATPAYWYEMTNITCDRAIIHYLQWHSTILDIADFAQTGDTQKLSGADFARGGLLEAVNSLYSSALQAKVVSDRQGKLWSEIDINFVQTGSRPNRNAMDWTRADWVEELDIRAAAYAPTSYVEAGGVVYDPTAPSGTVFAYLAGAPGIAPGYEGGAERVSGLVLTDQNQLNILSGLLLARSQAKYPEITVQAAGAYSNLDIAPQEFIRLTLAASDTWRQLVWSKKRYIVTGMTWAHDPEAESLVPTLTLREETSGPPGDTIIIPAEPPYTENDLPDWNIVFPPLLPLPPIFPPILPQPPSGNVIYLFVHGEPRYYRTRNFMAGSPTWEELALPGNADPSHAFLNLNDPVNGAFTMSHGGMSGTFGYMTNNLDSASPTWVPWWGMAESYAACLPTLTIDQFHFNDIHQEPNLGYFIGEAQIQTIGNTERFIYGAPGGWSYVIMGNAGGYENYPHVVRYAGGTTILASIQAQLFRSSNLGATQAGWTTYNQGGNKLQIWPVGGPNVLWADDGDTGGGDPTGYGATQWCPHLMLPMDHTLGAHSVPIRLVCDFNASLQWFVMNAGTPMSFGMTFVWDGGSRMYGSLQSRNPASAFWQGNYAFAVKDIGTGGWQIRWRSDVGSLSPIAVFGPEPDRLASMYHDGLNSYVAYTADGGGTWQNKNGNLPTLRTGISKNMAFEGAPKWAGVFSIF